MYILLFKLNEAEYGILLKEVEFISINKDVVKMPDAREAVSGIVMLRGNVMPVYSLALRFGFMEQESSYLVVVRMEGMMVALEVGMIDRVIWIEEEAVIPLPAVVRTAQMCFREAFVYEGKLIGLLDIRELASQQDRKNLSLSMENYAKEMRPAERI